MQIRPVLTDYLFSGEGSHVPRRRLPALQMPPPGPEHAPQCYMAYILMLGSGGQPPAPKGRIRPFTRPLMRYQPDSPIKRVRDASGRRVPRILCTRARQGELKAGGGSPAQTCAATPVSQPRPIHSICPSPASTPHTHGSVSTAVDECSAIDEYIAMLADTAPLAHTLRAWRVHGAASTRAHTARTASTRT